MHLYFGIILRKSGKTGLSVVRNAFLTLFHSDLLVFLNPVHKRHLRLLVHHRDRLLVRKVKYSLCLNCIGCLKRVLILRPGFRRSLRNE